MAQNAGITTETLLSNWNAQFEDLQLTVEDLKRPLMFMKALFKVFDRLGIDTDAVLQPPTEKELNEHLPYYRDLVPIINTMRVVNHIMKGWPQQNSISINHLVQPNLTSSTGILMLLHNLMLFYNDRQAVLAPLEDELFARSQLVQELEEKKIQLQDMLNTQAEEKGNRAERVERLNTEIVQLEEQLVVEQQTRDQHKHDLEAIQRENDAAHKLIEQKKATLDNLLAEKERLKALRVYDAEEVKAKADQATQSVQEAEEKLSTLGGIIAQKENSLKLLQTKVKPYLDSANNLLEEIGKLKDGDAGDLDGDLDSKDGELQMLNMTVAELKAQLSELKARRDQDGKRWREAQHKREQERIALESAIRDGEEKTKEHREFISLATQRTDQLKEATKLYEKEKIEGTQLIRELKEGHDNSIQEWDDALMGLVTNLRTKINNKLYGKQE